MVILLVILRISDVTERLVKVSFVNYLICFLIKVIHS